MDDLTRAAIREMIGRSNHPVNNKINALLIRATHHNPEVIRTIMDARAEWLTYLTTTQSKWIDHTRRRMRAVHHDSVDIRERYVRCQ